MFKDFCWIKCFRMDRLYCLFYSMIGIHYRNYVMMNSPTFLEDFYDRELVWSILLRIIYIDIIHLQGLFGGQHLPFNFAGGCSNPSNWDHHDQVLVCQEQSGYLDTNHDEEGTFCCCCHPYPSGAGYWILKCLQIQIQIDAFMLGSNRISCFQQRDLLPEE